MFKSADIQSGLLLWAKTQIMPRHPSQRHHGSSFVIIPALGYAREGLHFTFWPLGLHQQTQVCVSADWANIRAVRRGIVSDWKTHATVRRQRMSFISSIISREKVTRRSNTLVGFQWRLQVFNFWENNLNICQGNGPDISEKHHHTENPLSFISSSQVKMGNCWPQDTMPVLGHMDKNNSTVCFLYHKINIYHSIIFLLLIGKEMYAHMFVRSWEWM